MCAIFGIVGRYDEKAAKRAFATLSHRGPDASGIVMLPNLFLAHHRLSVIDLSPEADQPMQVGEAFIVMNGEVYNYRELAQELNEPMETGSDTEVTLKAFLKFEAQFAKKLRGMYATAIWHKERLHLFRDPFGKKPLYYAQKDGVFIFSSEIKAILAYFPQIKWSRERITSYLFCQSFISPSTFYPEISQVEPGGYLLYEDGRSSERVDDILILPKKDRRVGIERVEELLVQSVSYRLVADAPLGALLSGGVDSSLVAAMAVKLYKEPLPTFTVGFDGYKKYDERGFAEDVARHIGSEHCSFEMGMDDFLESVDELAAHLDEPLGDPAAVPLWFLSKRVAKRGVKVLLSGDGADELFFGYRPYYEMADIEKAKDLKYKRWLHNYFRANYSPNREWEWYKRVFGESVLFRSSAELFTDLQQNRLLKQNVKDDSSLNYIKEYVERFKEPEGPQWYGYIDFKVQLTEVFLKKLDRVTMAHGIEARSPFLDRSLVTELFSCDPDFRMGSETKWLLKEVAKSYLPSHIVKRKKKGFSYPFIEWLHESKEIDRVVEMNRTFGFFREDALEFLLQKSKKGRFKHHLYAIWFLYKWLEKRT